MAVLSLADWLYQSGIRDDQAKATGGANRPPPNDPLARSVSKKNTIMSLGVDTCFAKLLDQGGNKTFFPFGVSP